MKSKNQARPAPAEPQLPFGAEQTEPQLPLGAEGEGSAPDAPFPSADPGDETARRYFYQYSYAAILLCSLLDDGTRVVELLCEHHEDILLKFADGTFSAIQVKTRTGGADPWRSTDEEMVGSLRRFACLEDRFPGCFREFVIASNHAFLCSKGTKSDLPYLLELARGAASAQDCDSKLKPLLKKLAQAAGCSEATTLSMLKKCRTDDSLPKLDGIRKELQTTLTIAWPAAGALPFDTVTRASGDIIAECGRAAALDHAQCLPAYISATPGGDDLEAKARLDGKRFDRSRVIELVERLLSRPTLLEGIRATLPSTGSTEILERKLALGGFSVVSVNSARDLRAAAEHLGIEWLSRFGENEGLRRHGHIRSVVLRDSATAYEETKRPGEPFGPLMQAALRRLLGVRRREGSSELFGCSDEHLEGHAFSLTSECQVVWSDPPPRFEGDASGPGQVSR